MPAKLTVKRFVILKSGHFVYDQTFHGGLNIIRGDNGTGKSSVMDLLSYSLGEEITNWTKEQEACQEVLVEISINERPFCLKREIVPTGKAAMLFFEGDVESALKDSKNWFRYPNRRSSETHSYSQQLFEMMGLPQHKTDDSKNLTMHQILRLMYVDQLSLPSSLLKDDSIFDNALIRRAIGEYMLGIDDLEAHNLRQDLIEANKNFASVEAELGAIYSVLGSTGALFRREQVIAEIDEYKKEAAAIEEEKAKARASKLDQLDAANQKKASEIIKASEELATERDNLTNEKSLLSLEAADTRQFVRSIEARLIAIEKSSATSNEIGDIVFAYCPACLSPINAETAEHICGLCKADKRASGRHYSYIQMTNELRFQHKESKILIDAFERKLSEINAKIQVIDSSLSLYRSEYSSIVKSLDSLGSALDQISKKAGYLESKIAGAGEKLTLADRVETLIEHKTQAQTIISSVKSQLEKLEAIYKHRSESVYADIEGRAKTFLIADGGYENAFNEPEEVAIDFSRNKMAVNGRSKFSASSMAILKNSVRSAIYLHCIEDELARFPSLLLMDNIEDKGMTEERSQNFQRTLVDACEKIQTPFQIICTTSMIDPVLNESAYVVGPYYKKGEHTLNFLQPIQSQMTPQLPGPSEE